MSFLSKIYRKFKYRKYLSFGDKSFADKSVYGYLKNVCVDDNCYIGYRVHFMSFNANVILNKGVVVGPEVLFVTGNHRFDIVGKFIFELTEEYKRDIDDQDIVVEEDVWIGARCIILKGVTIGKGSVVGAGSIVTKNVEPYSIVAGNPAKIIGHRFNEDEIVEHEKRIKR